uniref:Uncharacterized protein n=1 Tax=Oryza barthii TaxID=65489 RepID=A0A0D3HFX2_9ORYZ
MSIVRDPAGGSDLEDPEESKKEFCETPYACRFFMWEGQYEQFLADGHTGYEQFNVEALSSMGIEGLPLKGCAALGRMLVYLAVVQALLLLLILVVVISK